MSDTDAPTPEPFRDQTTPKMIPNDPKRKGFLIVAYEHSGQSDEEFSSIVDRLGYSVRPILVRNGSARKYILADVPFEEAKEFGGKFFFKWLRHRPEAGSSRKPCSGDCRASGKCVRPGCICINGQCT